MIGGVPVQLCDRVMRGATVASLPGRGRLGGSSKFRIDAVCCATGTWTLWGGAMARASSVDGSSSSVVQAKGRPSAQTTTRAGIASKPGSLEQMPVSCIWA